MADSPLVLIIGSAESGRKDYDPPLANAESAPAAAELLGKALAKAGWSDAFLHSTGHGVGLDIHEAPWVGPTSSDTLESGHVVTVEPGVYLPEHGGVRIEDSLVVTADGCYPLTHTPKDLILA